MQSRSSVRRLTALLVLAPLLGLSPDQVEALQAFPLAPNPPRGLTVSPFFEGWYANPDGTYSLSFGYFNRNTQEAMYIPRGPENFMEPAEFDGFQPEHFRTRRQRGVFTVTVPAEFAESGQRVVWTLVNRGETLSVPGRVGVPAYELDYLPMAMGSLPPVVRFEAEGAYARGPTGITFDQPLTTSVGTPLTLKAWATDESVRRTGASVRVNVLWDTHQGPASVEFTDEESSEEPGGGEVSVKATFSEPGEYVIRLQADNFTAQDSSSGDQCCWSNGYFRVNVTP